MWLLRFLFLLLQMCAIAFSIRTKIDFVVASSDLFVTEIAVGKLISRILRAKLVVDVASCPWYETVFRKEIAKKMLKKADSRITSTHSMEVILGLGGLTSVLVPDLPDEAFKPDKNARPVIQKMFDLTNDTTLIAVTCCDDIIDNLKDFAQTTSARIAFFVCGSGKQRSVIDSLIRNASTENVKFFFVPFQYDLYPLVLSSCDIGVCGNGSPNVVDIAMQVLELQMSSLPIVALRYGCVNERVIDGVNGFVVKDGNELIRVLKGVIDKSVDVKELRTGCDIRRTLEARVSDGLARIFMTQ